MKNLYKTLIFMFLANITFANNIQLTNVLAANNPNDNYHQTYPV